MADLVGKLGQTIKGSVSGFGAGLKGAAISGNPALFGAALGTMEKVISKKFDEDKKERAKDREERRRDRQFDEEKENEQKKVDSDILKSLRSIEKLMEALLGKKESGGGGGLLAQLSLMLRKLIGPLAAALTALVIALDDVLSDIVKAFSSWAKRLAGKGLGFVDDLLKSFGTFFRNIFDRIKSIKLGGFIDDLLKSFKGFFTSLFDKFKGTSFGQFIDDALKSVKVFFSDFFKKFSTKLASFFDIELDIFKGLRGKLGAGWAKTKDLFNKSLLKVTEFFDEIAKLPIIGKLAKLGGEGIKRMVRAIPIIGNLVMVIEGIFAAFDTETLADTLGKSMENINWQDRLIGLFGGLIGSIFGILDLIPLAFKSFFNIDMAFADGESIQTKATRLITQFIYDFFAYFDGVFKVITGIFTLDGPLIKQGMKEMELIVEDWFTGFKNFIGNIVKVPFAKMTNAVAEGIETMVNGVIEAMNSFVGYILDGLAMLPGISKSWANEKKQQMRVEHVNIGRMDESPYVNDTSARQRARQATQAQNSTDAARNASRKAAADARRKKQGAEASTGPLNQDGITLLNRVMDEEGIVDSALRDRLIKLARVESSLNPNAKGPVISDPKSMHVGDRAYGLLQIMPKTAPEVGFSSADIQDPEKAARAGVRYFIKNLNRFGGDMDAATVAHHSGPGGAQRWLASGSAGTRDVATGLSTNDYLAKVAGTPSVGGGMVQAGYKSSSGVSLVENEVLGFARTKEDKQKITDAIVAYRDQRRQNDEQIDLMQEDARRQVQYREEDNKYRIERDALQKRFHDTLETGYRNILTSMAGPGGFGSTAPGAARNAVEQAIGPAFEKLGTKIFGKDMGGQMGQIFTQLTGSYADQIATQIIGPMLFGGNEGQANRFFGSLASGDKKAAMEDLIYGMTGVATGFRSAIGYEEGAREIAKELADLTGTPFNPLFNLDKETKIAMEQAQATAMPVVEAINYLGDRLTETPSPVGGGGQIVTADGQVIAASQGIYGSGGYMGTPGYVPGSGPGAAGGMPATTRALGNLGSMFLGQRLGVNTGTFGGSMAQAGLTTAIQAGLTGGNILQSLQSINMIGNMGRSIATAGGHIFAKGMEGGVQQMIGTQMASFGGGMSLGGSGGYYSTGSFSSMNTAGQAGYVAGVIGSAMTAKSISDAFSGGYKSGVGDAVAVIGSFFDPTGGFIAGTVGAVVNRLFGRKAPQVTDTGITGTLGLDKSNLKQYTDILEKGGTYRSDKRYTNYADLDPKLVKAIQSSIGALTDGIKETGKIMGFDRPGATAGYRAAYEKLLEGSFTQDVKVSLKGKSPEEVQEIMQNMIEDFADAYIRDAFGATLDKFAREGERLFETFDRLTTAAVAMSDIALKLRYDFKLLNLSMDEFQAADYASTFFDLAGGVEKYSKDIHFFFENFYSAEEQLEYAVEKGRDLMQASLEKVGLDAAYSVQGLTDMMGETFEGARKAYRKVVEDFIAANGGMEAIVKKGDPQVIEQLARLQGELAQEYYATTRALQELDRVKGTSKEALQNAARALFQADIAATGRVFATGGIATGPTSGYPAMLHGTEAVIPLPDRREIPVELRTTGAGAGGVNTFINNVIGNGNATVRSTPTTTNVISATPMATSGSSANRVVTPAY